MIYRIFTILFALFISILSQAFTSPVKAADSCYLNFPNGFSITLHQDFVFTVNGGQGNTPYETVVYHGAAFHPDLKNTDASGFAPFTLPAGFITQGGPYVFHAKNILTQQPCSNSPYEITAAGPGPQTQCSGFLSCISGKNPAENFVSQGLPAKIMTRMLPIVISLLGFLAVIMIVISGIQYIISSGNPEAAMGARNRMTYAIVGFVLAVLAFAILAIVNRIFLGGTGVV